MPQCNRDAESRDVCSQARVTDTPMWVIGGTALAGYQEPASLQQFVDAVDGVASHLRDAKAVVYGRDGCIWYVSNRLFELVSSSSYCGGFGYRGRFFCVFASLLHPRDVCRVVCGGRVGGRPAGLDR